MMGRTYRDDFLDDLLGWLNLRFGREGGEIRPTTPLFSDPPTDPAALLRIVAWTERALGRAIPDDLLEVDNFRTPRRIAEVFAESWAPPAERTARRGAHRSPGVGEGSRS